MINKLIKDYPSSINSDEYRLYYEETTRENASRFITHVFEDNINDVSNREDYVGYIANRPRVERLGDHGLFSMHDDINLNEVMNEVKNHQGNVWTHIVSLKREDASRLGFDEAKGWITLTRSLQNDVADAMKIKPDNLRWYAAFHNEGNHPHIHMVAYSIDPREGFVTKNGIEKIKKLFSKKIFNQELIHMYQQQTQVRDSIKKYSEQKVIDILNNLDKSYIENEKINNCVQQLRESLKEYKGRLYFAYIPKESKQIINDILREMEKDENLKVLYEQWLNYKQDINEVYSDKLIDKLPLLEQKEFKSLKNMILKEVMDYKIVIDFKQTDCSDLFDEVKECLYKSEFDKALEKLKDDKFIVNEFAKSLTSELLFMKQQGMNKSRNESTFQTNVDEKGNIYIQKSTGMIVSRFFHHVSNISQKTLPTPNMNPMVGVDKKLRFKLLQKKEQLGHKRDEHGL